MELHTQPVGSGSTLPAESGNAAQPTDPSYDVFLSYSHKDREWVEDYLLKRRRDQGSHRQT